MTIIIDSASNKIVNERFCADFIGGKSGFIDQASKIEGDGKTPLGRYKLRFGFYRADKLPHPPLNSERPLRFIALKADDGWCDDPKDALYNRFVKLPFAASHEKLWRDDIAYDIILVMSHNDSPPQTALGSAVFIHLTQIDKRKTQGCIALDPEDMVRLLPMLQEAMEIELR